MAILGVFDRGWVINLPERADRRRGTERELARLGLALGRDGLELMEAARPADAGAFPSLGARGCFESHLEVLKAACRARAEAVLVLEDDVRFEPLLVERRHDVAGLLQERTWDLVWLGHALPVPPGSPLDLLPYDGEIVTSPAYGVRGHVLAGLIEFLEQVRRRPAGHADGGPMHVDGAFSTFRAQHGELVTRIAAPSLVGQRSSRSDISPRWFDRLPAVRSLIGLARFGRRWIGA